MQTYLTNATLILPDETILGGSLVIEDDRIAAICPESGRGSDEIIDLEGDILMPGLIDLHGDAIEQEINPRPKANLPMDFAILQGDRKCALAGITTTFHAIGFHGEESTYRNSDSMCELARRIHAFSPHGLIDHRIHCRFEMPVPSGMEYIRSLASDGICALISLNNHTPGQGQYRDMTFIRRYWKEKNGWSDAQIEAHCQERLERSRDAEAHGEVMARFARELGVPLASHDDEDAEKIILRHSQGASISEFPLSVEAATAAKERGMHALVGSPNVMRGGSTGTGEKAIELIGAELANCLVSDYAPGTLLPAVFAVAEQLAWPLDRAVRLGTLGPARAGRLEDRGAILEGFMADLIAVQVRHGLPVTRMLWSAGRATLAAG